MHPKIAIVGAGGFGREVAWLISDINAKEKKFDWIGYFDDHFEAQDIIEQEHFLGTIDDLNQWQEPLLVVIAIGNPATKERILGRINNPNIGFATLVHPSVLFEAGTVHIGVGSILCAGNILTTNIRIGQHVILNLACTVGHDSQLGDCVSVMPGVNISGQVILGKGVYVGTGAKLINGLTVGENTTIGAGAVVSRSLPSGVTAVGVPAKPLPPKPIC